MALGQLGALAITHQGSGVFQGLAQGPGRMEAHVARHADAIAQAAQAQVAAGGRRTGG